MIAPLLIVSLLGQGPAWSLDSDGALRTGQERWIPFGARVSGTTDQVGQALKAGVRDLAIEWPSTGAAEAVRLAEEAGAQYMLALSSAPPPSKAIFIEPEAYRFGPYTGAARVTARIPGASRALVVIAPSRDPMIAEGQNSVFWVDTPGGQLSLELKAEGATERVALLFPEVSSIRIPDLGAGFDQHRDRILSQLRTLGRPKGLRAILDPIGQVPQFSPSDLQTIPTSERFRRELKTELISKYGTPQRAALAWEIAASDIDNFDVLARMIPLYSDLRGIGFVIDPETRKAYRVNRQKSLIWRDLRESILAQSRRRYLSLVQTIKQVTGVPVIQTWSGWNGPYGAPGSGIDGLGVRLTDSGFSDVLQQTGRAAVSNAAESRVRGLFQTELALTPGEDWRQYEAAVREGAELGVRGWFFRVSAQEGYGWISEVGGRIKASLQQSMVLPRLLPFPESASDPMSAQRLAPGVWAVPSPEGGARIDLGGPLEGYQFAGANDAFFALWSKDQPVRLKLRTPDPKSVRVTSADGSLLPAKVSRNHVELTVGPVPVLLRGVDQMPIPEEAVVWTQAEFDLIVKQIPDNARSLLDEIVAFRNARANLGKDPDAFSKMRAQLFRLRIALQPGAWMEAEVSRSYNWSEVTQVSGASSNRVLTLRSRVQPSNGLYFADYATTPPRDGMQRLWIAARGDVTALQLSVLGNRYEVAGAGIRPHSNGFRWYSFPEMNLPGQLLNFRLQVPGEFVGQIELDRMVILPAGLRPDGASFDLVGSPTVTQ